MNLSVTSIASTVIFCGIAFLIIHCILKKYQYFNQISVRFLLICLLLLGIRLLIPIEFPLATNLYIHSVLPDICLFLLRPITFLNDLKVQTLLLYIWVLGIMFFIIRIIISYASLSNYIKSLNCIKSQYFESIITETIKDYKKQVHFRLVKTDSLTTPMIFGIFKPTILVPNIELTDQEWKYVFKHEITHYYNGDLLIKYAYEILHAIYWWFPVLLILKKQVSKLLEMNTDKNVVKDLSKMQRLEYADCLIKMAKLQTGTNNNHWSVSLSGFLTASDRIHFILADYPSNRKNPATLLVMAFLLVMILILPNFIIFEPYGVTPDVEAESFNLKEENAFYILNHDGTYDFYLNNEYQATVNNVFDENIIIYQNEKEIINEKESN